MVFKKIIFQNRYVALETGLDPPPFMANAILNFHFDFLHPSLSRFPVSQCIRKSLTSRSGADILSVCTGAGCLDWELRYADDEESCSTACHHLFDRSSPSGHLIVQARCRDRPPPQGPRLLSLVETSSTTLAKKKRGGCGGGGGGICTYQLLPHCTGDLTLLHCTQVHTIASIKHSLITIKQGRNVNFIHQFMFTRKTVTNHTIFHYRSLGLFFLLRYSLSVDRHRCSSVYPHWKAALRNFG